MTNLKRIAAYETTDGQKFDDKDAAKKHQVTLDRQKGVEALVAAALPNNDGFLDAVSVADVAKFIVDSAEDLRAVLPKRAKSSKKEAEPAAPQAGGAAPTDTNTAGLAPADSQPATTTLEASPQAQPEATTLEAKPADFAWPAGLSGVVASQTAAAAA